MQSIAIGNPTTPTHSTRISNYRTLLAMKRRIMAMAGIDNTAADTLHAIAAAMPHDKNESPLSLAAIGGKLATKSPVNDSRRRAASRRVAELKTAQSEIGKIFVEIVPGITRNGISEKSLYRDFLTPAADTAAAAYLKHAGTNAEWRNLPPEEKRAIYDSFAQTALESLPPAPPLEQNAPGKGSRPGVDTYAIERERAIVGSVDKVFETLISDYGDTGAALSFLKKLVQGFNERYRGALKLHGRAELAEKETIGGVISGNPDIQPGDIPGPAGPPKGPRPETEISANNPPMVSIQVDRYGIEPGPDMTREALPDTGRAGAGGGDKMSTPTPQNPPIINQLPAAPLSARKTAPPAETLQWAREYARAGWKILLIYPLNESGQCTCPAGADCQSPGKHPRGGPGKVLSVEEIERAVSRQGWGLGIVTGAGSGIDILDFDGEEGERLYVELADKGWIKACKRSFTGGGGVHLPIVHIPGLFKGNYVKLVPGLDIRTTGGCIIAPPTIHASGRSYLWGGWAEQPVLSPCPEFLNYLKSLIPAPSLPPAGGPAGHRGPGKFQIWGFPDGERGWELFRVAAGKWGRGESRESIESEIITRAGLCSPPYPESLARAAVQSVVSRYPKGRR